MSKIYNVSEYKLRTKLILEKLHKSRSSYISCLPNDMLNIIIRDCCLSPIRTFNNYRKFNKYINLKRDRLAYSFKPKYFKIIFPDNTFHITKYSGARRFIGNAFESDDDKQLYAIDPNYGIPCNYRNSLPGFTVNIWILKEGMWSSTRQRMNIEYIKIQRLFKK